MSSAFPELFNVFYRFLQNVLPLSPFRQFIDDFGSWPYLGWLNWFFPFRTVLVAFAVYGNCLIMYYTYVVVMRWLKVISE